MSVIVLLIVAGGLVAGGFLAAFIWAVSAGQFDDTGTPPFRMLVEDLDERDRSPSPHRGTPHVEPRY
jgi:cbb3-type cytochrome oxidase maturation protein